CMIFHPHRSDRDPAHAVSRSSMKTFFIGLVVLIFGTAPLHHARAGQADDVVITVVGNTPGVTPFISQVTLNASDTSTLKGIQFTIAPKPGSVIRPLSGNYARSYLIQRGFLQAGSGEIHLPVYGLYAGFSNTVTLRYYFNDGSSSQATTTITTASYTHPCGLDSPTRLQARTNDTTLSYDYMLVKGGCPSGSQPVIVDTDGALRWVAPTTFPDKPSFFFDSAIYQTRHADLYRLELDGTITLLRNYQDIGVTVFDHNIDIGKSGMILEP